MRTTNRKENYLYSRWVSKSSNNVSTIANDVKARLRRIAHSITNVQLEESLHSFKSWEHFKGKLKTWFEGIYLVFSVKLIGKDSKRQTEIEHTKT